MPRKPKQERSRQMYEAIVEAGFVSIAKHGLEGTTTRHLARIAGVSVGTLYQYFEDKEGVYRAMHERFVDDLTRMLRAITPELVQKNIKDATATILYRFSELLGENNGRYLEYARHMGHVDHAEHVAKVERVLLDIATQYAMHNPDVMRLRSVPSMVYIVINGGVYTIIRYLSSPTPSLRFEDIVNGLSMMVAGYYEAELKAIESGK